MKKKIICFVLLVALTSFTSKIDIKKINGNWQIYEYYYDGKTKLNLELYPDCEKKEILNFNDSIIKNTTYSSFGTKCFKAINTCKYKIENTYSSHKKNWEYTISTNCKSFSKYLILIELNDTILKIGSKHNTISDEFDVIKTYKKIKKNNSK